MAQPNSYAFSYQEVATALLKQQGIHEGIWQVAVTIGFGVNNFARPENPTELRPAVLTIIDAIGLQKVTEKTNLTVDAAVVNPKTPAASKKAAK
ncbi:MAG TPA: hypothetical protein VME63_13790 [Dyella sp.]|uniref:hypothetical protein n=1 Tax=Dyella sp. TaxID=1869338 RepID=UPI002BD47B61|nr:hypothetical protein [Dyella sp.]HTV86477.1 hypothetical protein [Dyella sp.]